MAIISSVLKLVNVGGAVGDEGKDKKEENSSLSSDPQEVSFPLERQQLLLAGMPAIIHILSRQHVVSDCFRYL
jgi:hypothetical protein